MEQFLVILVDNLWDLLLNRLNRIGSLQRDFLIGDVIVIQRRFLTLLLLLLLNALLKPLSPQFLQLQLFDKSALLCNQISETGRIIWLLLYHLLYIFLFLHTSSVILSAFRILVSELCLQIGDLRLKGLVLRLFGSKLVGGTRLFSLSLLLQRPDHLSHQLHFMSRLLIRGNQVLMLIDLLLFFFNQRLMFEL